MQAVLFLGMAVVAGAMIPFQAGANAVLGRALGSPLWAALLSLCVSALSVLPVLMVLRVPFPAAEGLSAYPKWIWIGGIGGAIYVIAAVALAPRLGAAGFMVAVVTGQILASLVIDRIGAVGFAVRPLDSARLIGAGLIVLGLIVMQGPQIWAPLRAALFSQAGN